MKKYDLTKARKYKKTSIEDIEKIQKISARDWILKVLLIIFATGNIGCLVLYFFNGFGLTKLSDGVLYSLTAVTLAEIAGLLIIAVNFYFPKKENLDKMEK